jgi:hypothetical protein
VHLNFFKKEEHTPDVLYVVQALLGFSASTSNFLRLYPCRIPPTYIILLYVASN